MGRNAGNLGLNNLELGRGEVPLTGPKLLGLECIRRNDVQVPLWEWNGKFGGCQILFGLLSQVTEQVPVIAEAVEELGRRVALEIA